MLANIASHVNPPLAQQPLRAAHISARLPGVVTRRSLGLVIEMLREAKGWKQHELATNAGINFTGMSRIESGKQGLSHESLGRLADALGVRSSAIYAMAEQIEAGDKPLTDVVRVVLAFESMTHDDQVHLQANADAFAQRAATWDGVKRRKEDMIVPARRRA